MNSLGWATKKFPKQQGCTASTYTTVKEYRNTSDSQRGCSFVMAYTPNLQLHKDPLPTPVRNSKENRPKQLQSRRVPRITRQASHFVVAFLVVWAQMGVSSFQCFNGFPIFLGGHQVHSAGTFRMHSTTSSLRT